MIPDTILFDIDGTLLIGDNLPQNFEQICIQIKELQKLKINIGVCTNRPFDSNLEKIIDKYKIDGTVITEGGSCLYNKTSSGYVCVNQKYSINNIIELLVKKYIENNKLSIDISYDKHNISENIYINKNRISTATVYIPLKLINKVDSIKQYLSQSFELKDYLVEIDATNNLKINVFPEYIDKFVAISKHLNSDRVILVTDYEKPTKVIFSNLPKIYSVGNNIEFNQISDEIFPGQGLGVEQILKEIRRKIMKNYEILSENCKIRWIDDIKLNGEKYTQVSGYVYNEENKLLIVKNGKTWTIPGGHPEPGETQLETLERELMEEACVTLKDIKYLGAVEVIENGETYYQLRYTAKVLETLPFDKEWEIDEREFVSLEDLPNYIKWSKGVTFSQQIEASKKIWNI